MIALEYNTMTPAKHFTDNFHSHSIMFGIRFLSVSTVPHLPKIDLINSYRFQCFCIYNKQERMDAANFSNVSILIFTLRL